MRDFIVIDDSVTEVSKADIESFVARMPKKPVREHIFPDGTKYTEFVGGSVLVQTPLRSDGWLSKALGESK